MATEEVVVNSRLFLSVSVPKVTMELRSRKSSLLDHSLHGPMPCSSTTIQAQANSNSIPFALVILENVDLSLINSEQFLSKLKIVFQSIVVEDLYEETHTQWALLRSINCNADTSIWLTDQQRRDLIVPYHPLVQT
uniref:Uncharacterized protein n=1 Tax=Ditylenchus dipsaci TaxID=166011 RepID=A0A915ES66_9BILA